MNLIDKLIGVIVSPRQVMREIGERPMIEEAVLIVGLLSVLMATSAFVQVGKINYVYEGFEGAQADMMASIGVLSGVAGALIGVFIGWAVLSAAVHVIGMALGGEGEFKQTLAITGYSLVPMILGGLVILALTMMVDPITITISASNPMAAGQTMQGIYGSPLYVAMDAVRIISKIWGMFLIFLGVQNTHKISASGAAAAAGIPTILSLALSYGPRLLF